MLQPCYQKPWFGLAEVTWHAPTLLLKALFGLAEMTWHAPTLLPKVLVIFG
jgi:hypothetical protein